MFEIRDIYGQRPGSMPEPSDWIEGLFIGVGAAGLVFLGVGALGNVRWMWLLGIGMVAVPIGAVWGYVGMVWWLLRRR